MATKNGGTVNIGIKFNVDKSPLNQITKSLQAVQDAAKKDLNLDSEFKQAAAAAEELQQTAARGRLSVDLR